jgi:beta-lactamase regulating signal transducer with metallopeptidase domain
MNHTIQALAWTLIHFCWQAAAIAVVYRVASVPLAGRSSNARYLAALTALLLMLAAAAVTFSWEIRTPVVAPIRFAMPNATAPIPAEVHTGYKFSPILTPASDPVPSFSGSLSVTALLPWIDAFWLIGVLALSARSIGGWWLLERLRKSATVEAPAAAAASFRRIANALGLRKTVLLRVSSAIAGPVTIGTMRALVLLPLSAITLLSPDELEVVFAHELAHVRRSDFFWNLVQIVVETLFFFHPAVWWIGARIRHERELCCDDLALKVCPDPLVYAHALFRLEEQRGIQLQLAMALDGHQSSQTLRMRIARILGEPLAQSVKRGPLSLAAVGSLVVVLMLPVPHVLASLSPAQNAASKAATIQQAVTHAEISSVRTAAASIHAGTTAARAAVAAVIAQQAAQPAAAESDQEPSAQNRPHKGDYIDQMKAAGYDVDLDKMIAMKIQGVTPEYAQQMSQLGFGKLTADQLISCKIQGVDAGYIAQIKAAGYGVDIDKYIAMKIQGITPEYAENMSKLGFGKLTADQLIASKIQGVDAGYIAEIKAAGYNVDIDKYIAMKIQGVTPEYVEKMSQLGFGKLNADDLISSKIQGVTPDYIAQLKRDGLQVNSVHDAISYRIFNVTPEFIAQMKAAGFPDLTHDQLMALRVQGVTPEYATAIRKQYPGATVDDIVKTKIFNINADFIADARRHGFNDLTLDKLVKLRISGILDDTDSDTK